MHGFIHTYDFLKPQNTVFSMLQGLLKILKMWHFKRNWFHISTIKKVLIKWHYNTCLLKITKLNRAQTQGFEIFTFINIFIILEL